MTGSSFLKGEYDDLIIEQRHGGRMISCSEFLNFSRGVWWWSRRTCTCNSKCCEFQWWEDVNLFAGVFRLGQEYLECIDMVKIWFLWQIWLMLSTLFLQNLTFKKYSFWLSLVLLAGGKEASGLWFPSLANHLLGAILFCVCSGC